jgi:hypothetical protein
MSAVAQPRTGSFLAIGSFVVIVGAFIAVIVVVQQALVARSPSGYQVAIVNVARQIGLAPPQPTFGDPAQAPSGYGYGYGYGFVGRGGGPGTGVSGGPGAQLTVAAQAIGIPLDQLRAELSTSSLTEVAQAHGVDPSAVATAMKSAGDAQVDAAVTSGRLTADQAAQRKTQTEQRIDQLMTQAAPFADASAPRPRGRQSGSGSE